MDFHDLATAQHDIEYYMRAHGHHVNVELVHDEPTNTLRVNLHMRRPWWLYALRYLAHRPQRLAHYVVDYLDTRVEWHWLRGHTIERYVIAGDDNTPSTMHDHYCHTCKTPW